MSLLLFVFGSMLIYQLWLICATMLQDYTSCRHVTMGLWVCERIVLNELLFPNCTLRADSFFYLANFEELTK